MNINPNDPNVDSSIDMTPTDIPAPPASLPGDTGSAPPTDSISTSTDIGATGGVGFDFLQLDRPLTIMDFARVVLDTIDNFRQEIYVMERLEAATMKKFHIAIAVTALSLAELYLQFKNLSNDMQTEAQKQNSEIAQQNIAISNINLAYKNTEPKNGSDKEAIDQINWAIDQYNNGDIDSKTFQAYVDDYNDYAKARNDALSSATNTYNTKTSEYNITAVANNKDIQRFNTLLTLIGQDKMPEEQTLDESYTFPVLTQPYEVPISGVAERQDIPALNPVPVPPAQDYIANYWGPLVDSILPSLRELFVKLDLADSFAELQKYHFKGKVLALPDAFVQFTPEPLIAGTAGNHSLVAVGLSSIALGLESKFLETVLSKILLDEAAKQFQFPVTGNLQNLLRFFTIEWLVQQGFVSGLQALGQLANIKNSTDIVSTPFKLSSSLAFVGQIQHFIESGALVDIAEKYLKSQLTGPADVQQLKEAAQIIASALSVSLIQFGLFQIASTLHLPGLLPQIFGNLSSHPELIEALRAPINVNLTDILSNPISLSLLQATLIDNLINSSDTDRTSAESLINSVLETTIAKTPYQSDIEFNDALISGFQTAGLDQNTAETLAAAALAFIEAEKVKVGLYKNGGSPEAIAEALLTYAPLGIISAANVAIVASIGPGSIDSDLVRRETLEDSILGILISRGYERDGAQRILNVAINDVLSISGFSSEGIFRESLKNALVRAGVSPDDAIDLAEKAAISQRTQIVEELFTSSLSSILTIEQLRAAISDEVVGRLAPNIGSTEAGNLNDRLIGLIFGNEIDGERNALSIIRLLEDQLTLFKNQTQNKHQDKVADVVREFLRPLVELFILNERIMDPANTLILSMQTGMYSRPMPSNFQRTVDFLG